MKPFVYFFFVLMIATSLVACTRATQTQETIENTNTETNQPAEVNTNNTIVPQDIIYGTNQDAAFVEASRQDCENKGGTFNTCGSPCLDESGFCAQVCALRCEF
ncbi:MAG: hypothetical protein HYV32_05685 [Candidatus Kerfeldbacteria bacterium]|nr:hypothetical protein [Candidatus Kerfeldbacteria bacterium]